MRVLRIILLGCALLLPTSISVGSSNKYTDEAERVEHSLLDILAGEENARVRRAADDTETDDAKTNDAKSDDTKADDVLIKKKGCEDHKTGEQWGSSDHDNCICRGADSLCYHVDCFPGSKIARDFNGLWDCKVDSQRKGSSPGGKASGNAKEVKITGVDAFGAFSGVLGIAGFIMDRIESAQTTAQLNEIQGQIRTLDRKVDDLTRSVSDLRLGQQYLQQVALYGRDELVLRNVLGTLAGIQINDDGQYVHGEKDVQSWANMVTNYNSDLHGYDQVMFNMLDMVKSGSNIFDGKSLFEVYHERLTGDLQQYTEKMPQKVAQVYGLIAGGYTAWVTALRIKGRDTSAKVQEMEEELTSVSQTLEKYIKYAQDILEKFCPDGYTPHNDVCYKVIKESKTHGEASRACLRQGPLGRLAMAKDPGTNDFLVQLKNDACKGCQFHFGLTDFQEGQWKWADGSKLGSYDNWAPDEPNDGGGWWWGRGHSQDCAVFNKDSENGNKWDDRQCSARLYFICEASPSKVACEGETLQLRCSPGKKIHVISASYGCDHTSSQHNPCKHLSRGKRRFLPPRPPPDTSCSCQAINSFNTVWDNCEHKDHCFVSASNSNFGDPCPGTIKYLTADYNCV